ncbi:hypothetical protein ACWDSJ_15525 [Nocardia sp. NPDC003482]
MAETGDERRVRHETGSVSLLGEVSRVEIVVHLTALALGSMADLLAFKTVVDLLLGADEWISWGIAAGVTGLALTAATLMGPRIDEVRHGNRAARLYAILAAVVWALLGIMLVVVRWSSPRPTGSGLDSGVDTITLAAEVASREAHLGALFFGCLYLISGVGAALVAIRLANPVHRARADLRRQEARLTRARGHAERAQVALAHHSGEFERDLARRNQARADRQALGAEAAHYARVLMAQYMKDPRKTGVTESGPLPGPAHPVPEPGWDGDEGSAA